eukprot:3145409-Pyramimonas_sp.AAC.1
MSAARENPATADLREAVEQLQRQIQQLQDGGGEIYHRLSVESVLYLGVGATTKPQKRELVALINSENITDKQGCGFWPES